MQFYNITHSIHHQTPGRSDPETIHECYQSVGKSPPAVQTVWSHIGHRPPSDLCTPESGSRWRDAGHKAVRCETSLTPGVVPWRRGDCAASRRTVPSAGASWWSWRLWWPSERAWWRQHRRGHLIWVLCMCKQVGTAMYSGSHTWQLVEVWQCL